MRRIYKNLILNGRETDLVCEDGIIVSLHKTAEAGFDCGGLTVRAGLFDIHTHGALARDVMDGGAEVMAGVYGRRGITSFLPTTVTMPEDRLSEVTSSIPPREKGKAKIRGYHLEGPFIAEKKKGAQNPAYIQSVSLSLLDACPHATLITLAPELAGALSFIGAARARGVRVAIGHTEADYDTALAAILAGANCLTHTFNAMPAFSHRAPGPIGAALTGDGYVQVISDGVHLHPSVVLALYRMFGPDRMILISDTISAAGVADGEYSLGGLPTFVKEGKATLADGTLAGSTTFLDEGVRRAISFGIPREDAYRMASLTPARYMGLRCGAVEEGYEADFALYDQQDRAVHTIIDGEMG